MFRQQQETFAVPTGAEQTTEGLTDEDGTGRVVAAVRLGVAGELPTKGCTEPAAPGPPGWMQVSTATALLSPDPATVDFTQRRIGTLSARYTEVFPNETDHRRILCAYE